jgi:hypothetical protein
MFLVTGAVALEFVGPDGSPGRAVGLRDFPLAVAPFPGLLVYGLCRRPEWGLVVERVGVEAGAEGRLTVQFLAWDPSPDPEGTGGPDDYYDDQWKWHGAPPADGETPLHADDGAV